MRVATDTNSAQETKMDFMINPIDGSSEKDLSHSEGDEAQPEEIPTPDTPLEDQLPDEAAPQSDEATGSFYTPIDELPFEADASQPLENPGTSDVSPESQVPATNDVPSSEETEPIYTPVEVPPLEDFDLQVDDDTDVINTSPEDQLVNVIDQQSMGDTQPIYTDQQAQLPDGFEPMSDDDVDATYSPQPEQLQDEVSPQPVEDTPPEYASQVDQPATEGDQGSIEINGSLSSIQEVQGERDTKKIALILSGGGARGAFQVGAEMYARQVKGYHWDIIAGVSVGALNGAMLAMHRYQRLLDIWNSITDSQVYTGGFNLPSVIGLLLGSKSFYGNAPLKKLMKGEFEAGKIIDDLHVGVVSLVTGDYVQFTKEFLELPEAILASASIPVIWPPVDISPDHQAMVDGGVRNISPVGDVLGLEPDEIVIINCSPQHPPVLSQVPQDVLSIGMRALDIMQNEIFVNDVKDFLRINALVQEAEKQGAQLHHPRTGRVLKYYPCAVIEPDLDLGGVLDFSHATVQTALKAGVKRAREVLGKP